MKRKEKTRKGFRLGYDRATQLQLHTLMLPGTVLMLLFSIVPLFGLLLAFKNYSVIEGIKGVFTSPWYGFQNFKVIFGNFDFKRMLVNTLGINLIGNLVNIVMAILFALFINEIARPRFKSFVQTVTYMPHFISIVVLVGMMSSFFSPQSGFINTAVKALGGQPVYFMGSGDWFRHMYVWSGVWQGAGWGSIIYLAALTGVSPELHESAMIDGANKLQRIWHIDLPAIMPTMAILLILNCGSIMSIGFDKVYLMQNDLNLGVSEVISNQGGQTGCLPL